MEEELSLVKQGYYQLKISAFSGAEELFQRALSEGDDPDAYIGLLLCQNALNDEAQLVGLPKPLASYLLYEKAIACASEQVKKKLQGYKEEQTALLEVKEKKYGLLKKGAEERAKSGERIGELLALCRELKNYGNTEELRAQLEKERAELESARHSKKKKRLAVLIPVCAAAVILIVIGVFLLALPKVDGVRYALTLNGFTVISCDSGVGEVVLPDEVQGVKVTGIGGKAFKNCKELTSVTLGAHVRKIERAAFNGCVNLREVKGSAHVSAVEENAFKGCVSLRQIVFAPDCAINADAFRDCSEDLEVYTGSALYARPHGEDDRMIGPVYAF